MPVSVGAPAPSRSVPRLPSRQDWDLVTGFLPYFPALCNFILFFLETDVLTQELFT